MLYLALGCAALALFVWIGRGRPFDIGRGWRIGSAALAIIAFAVAAFLAIRGGWGTAIVLGVAGLGLAVSSRLNTISTKAVGSEMSLAEAASMLGVAPDASTDEIKAAYLRLMQRVHPDAGGASGLAAQLNAARDVLLKRKR